MAFWHKWLPGFAARRDKAKAAASSKATKKSAERRRNEQSILDKRREILEGLERFQQEREASETMRDALDPDAARAAYVVEQMLLDLENKGK